MCILQSEILKLKFLTGVIHEKIPGYVLVFSYLVLGVISASLGTLEFSLLYDAVNCALHCTISKAKVCTMQDGHGIYTINPTKFSLRVECPLSIHRVSVDTWWTFHEHWVALEYWRYWNLVIMLHLLCLFTLYETYIFFKSKHNLI